MEQVPYLTTTDMAHSFIPNTLTISNRKQIITNPEQNAILTGI